MNSCRVAAESHDRLHVAPQSITVCSSQRAWHQRQEALTTDCHWQAIVEGTEKIKHVSLSVVRSWGVLEAASVVVEHDTLREMNQLSRPMLNDCFQANPMPFVFPVGPSTGWYHVIWPQHYNQEKNAATNTAFKKVLCGTASNNWMKTRCSANCTRSGLHITSE